MAIGILSLVRVSAERLAAFNAAGYTVLETAKYASRLEALQEAGKASDGIRAVLTNGRGGISAAEMELLPELELVCAAGAGYESVDLARAKSRGIAVANTPDMNAPAVADSAIMLLLASVRHLCEADRFVRAGGWQDQWRVETPTVCGKRLGIFGLGKIGKRIAHRAARGFDMEIGYHNRLAYFAVSSTGYPAALNAARRSALTRTSERMPIAIYAVTGRCARKNERVWRTASGILSLGSFHGNRLTSDFGASITDSMATAYGCGEESSGSTSTGVWHDFTKSRDTV